jgi:ABC-type transporter Mla subunit MlaD
MSRRAAASSVYANPVLVGAITTLLVVVGVYLSYHANAGLPFVPTYQLKVIAPNGANLMAQNEIREGGYRIGLVEEMRAIRDNEGDTRAEITLKIDKVASPVPVDSSINLRPRSVLGLKYVELTRGRSEEMFEDGDVMPMDQAETPVEIDDFFAIFDEKTRDASRENLKGFGNAFAMRGPDLNRTVAGLPRFLRHLEPVMDTLADPENRLDRFWQELGDAARVVAPIAENHARMFTYMANTFEAWSRDPEALKETITRSVPTLDAGLRSFPVQRPFLRSFERFSVALEDAAGEMPTTLPRITPALVEGRPVLRRSPLINRELGRTMVSLRELMEAPTTGMAFRALSATGATLNPTLRFVGPFITVCNYFNYSWTHAGEHLSERDPTGTSQRTLLNFAPRQKNSPGTLGATEPANGEQVQPGQRPAHLHQNVYSAAIDHQGNADCESGQRGYPERLDTFGDPRYRIVRDPHIPGNQGTTFTGRSRVPSGQTFSRSQEIGPLLPLEVDP